MLRRRFSPEERKVNRAVDRTRIESIGVIYKEGCWSILGNSKDILPQ